MSTPHTLIIVLFGVCFALFVSGLPLLIIGIRGRRTNDHPICRRCRFDLVGVFPPRDPAAASRCPECGTDLRTPRAVRFGQRRRRRIPLAMGVTLTALALLFGMLGALTLGRAINWYRLAPTALLIYQAEHSQPDRIAPQLEELARRQNSGGLTSADTAAVLTRALAVQSDLTLPWIIEWGAFVEAARRAGQVTDVQWVQYVRNAPVLSIAARDPVVEGEEWVIELSSGRARAGPNSGPPAAQSRLGVQSSEMIIDDQPARPFPLGASLGLSGYGTSAVVVRSPVPAPPGKHSVVVRMHCGALPPSPSTPSPPTWTVDLPITVNVLPAGGEDGTIELVNDPDAAAAVRKALTLENNILTTSSPRPSSPPDPQSPNQVNIEFRFNSNSPPYDLAFDMLLRERNPPPGSAPREWHMTELTTYARRTTSIGGMGVVYGFVLDRADLILRPSPAAAKKTLSARRIWNSELVIENVEIKWPKGGPPPEATPATDNSKPR